MYEQVLHQAHLSMRMSGSVRVNLPNETGAWVGLGLQVLTWFLAFVHPNQACSPVALAQPARKQAVGIAI